VLTINGRMRLMRVRWYCCEEGSETPTDHLLDQMEATISEGVREMACRINQDASSFEKAAANLDRTAHVRISKESLRQLVEAEGKSVLRQLQQGELRPNWTSEDCRIEEGPARLYLGCDGVKVPLVTDEEKKKRRQGIHAKRRRRGRRCKPLPRLRQGADCAYKDFKVAYLYDESKRYRYVGVSAGNHEAAGRLMQRMGEHVELSRVEEKIALIDGAPWIRNQIEFHGLTENIGLDFYHLQDNAQKAKLSVFGEDSEAGKTWVGNLMHTFKHQGYSAAWDLLVQTRSSLRSTSKRTAIDRLTQYAAERRDMIRYPVFRERGWQIGSGPTEAECKTTTLRVKGRGRRWDSPNAEAMMALAALHDSGMWNQHWTTLDVERN
jgi:hypothetical protein